MMQLSCCGQTDSYSSGACTNAPPSTLTSQPRQATTPRVLRSWSAGASHRWLGGSRGSRCMPYLPCYTSTVESFVKQIKRGGTIDQAGHFVPLLLTFLKCMWRRKGNIRVQCEGRTNYNYRCIGHTWLQKRLRWCSRLNAHDTHMVRRQSYCPNKFCTPC